MTLDLESLDWAALERLRSTFLSENAGTGPYWESENDLHCYDRTFGERIGWKWDAVLGALKDLDWKPAGGAPVTILDWGCGSGIAGRRVVDFLGTSLVERLLLYDHSVLAMEYAQRRAAGSYPGLRVERAAREAVEGADKVDLLVLSHVLNELTADAQKKLECLCARAAAILWVEPGSRGTSRALGRWRERFLSEGWQPVYPCPDSSPCGMLAAGNENHWCHLFARVPPGVHADSGWVRFGQRAGIDLRSLPMSCLVIDRTPPPPRPWTIRLLGRPAFHKGWARCFACDSHGVGERTFQKRDDPELFRRLRRGDVDTV